MAQVFQSTFETPTGIWLRRGIIETKPTQTFVFSQNDLNTCQGAGGSPCPKATGSAKTHLVIPHDDLLLPNGSRAERPWNHRAEYPGSGSKRYVNITQIGPSKARRLHLQVNKNRT